MRTGQQVAPLGCRLLGAGAMNSPRYAPAGLLIEHRDVRVMLDGGPGAVPAGRVDAWLVTDEQAELIRPIRSLAEARGTTPTARDFAAPGFSLERLPVIHTNHATYGYRIMVAQGSVAWAPEFLEFPEWAAGASLMFAEAAGWSRTIWFAGKAGGHMAALEVARVSKGRSVGRLVFAHIGRATLRAMDRGEQLPFGTFGEDSDLYVLDRRGNVRRYKARRSRRGPGLQTHALRGA